MHFGHLILILKAVHTLKNVVTINRVLEWLILVRLLWFVYVKVIGHTYPQNLPCRIISYLLTFNKYITNNLQLYA